MASAASPAGVKPCAQVKARVPAPAAAAEEEEKGAEVPSPDTAFHAADGASLRNFSRRVGAGVAAVAKSVITSFEEEENVYLRKDADDLGANYAARANQPRVDNATLLRTVPTAYDIPSAPASVLRSTNLAGEGALCQVFDVVFEGRLRALKILRPELAANATSVADLCFEETCLQRLDHPNLVRVYASGTEPRPWLVLERLGGGTLQDKLARMPLTSGSRKPLMRRKCLPYTAVLAYLASIYDALAYMHEEALAHSNLCLMHRDLKPANIMFTTDGVLKIIDMNLSKCIPRGETSDEAYNMTGDTGSPRYMAPEVMQSLPYNAKADVYSAALMGWEMAAVRPPFSDADPATFATDVTLEHLRPPMPEDWPEAFRRLLADAWAPEPHDRPTARQVLERIRALQAEHVSSSPLRQRRDSEQLRTRRRSSTVERVKKLLGRASTPPPSRPPGPPTADMVASDDSAARSAPS